jgi:hypothetical protein
MATPPSLALDGRAECELVINDPPPLRRVIAARCSKFGGLPLPERTGRLVLADPVRGCSPCGAMGGVASCPHLHGAGLLLQRGDCRFAHKARFAQQSGAAFAIVFDFSDAQGAPRKFVFDNFLYALFTFLCF